MPRKYIPLPLSLELNSNSLYNFLNNNFCKYIYKRGKYANQSCYTKTYEKSEYCKKHNSMLDKINTNYKIRSNTSRCLYMTKNGKCDRKTNDHYCKYHKPLELKIEPTKYNISRIKIIDDLSIEREISVNNLQLIKYEPNNIINKIKLLYKKRLKRLKYKKNKKNKNKSTKPAENIKVIKIKENLFKENNNYYTINFYEKKVIADNINGIKCIYCNTIRYTNSGPCTYPNCYNRSFDNYEFIKYYNIHGKHKISIYNKMINST
jgi:hypothetical protein